MGCKICGKPVHAFGLCHSCYCAEKYRQEHPGSRINQKKTEDDICTECGKKGTLCKGLCKACYSKQRYDEKHGVTQRRNQKSQQTKDIIESYNKGEMTQAELAKKYGISRQRVFQIVHGRSVR